MNSIKYIERLGFFQINETKIFQKQKSLTKLNNSYMFVKKKSVQYSILSSVGEKV